MFAYAAPNCPCRCISKASIPHGISGYPQLGISLPQTLSIFYGLVFRVQTTSELLLLAVSHRVASVFVVQAWSRCIFLFRRCSDVQQKHSARAIYAYSFFLCVNDIYIHTYTLKRYRAFTERLRRRTLETPGETETRAIPFTSRHIPKRAQ